MIRIRTGDVREHLAELPAQSVQCCVTSPPYYGLRDYGVAGQIGLEPTLAEYIATMVDVFRGVRRVLADDGVLFLNIGDSYHTDSPVRKSSAEAFSETWDPSQTASRGGLRKSAAKSGTFKNKDLMMVPARLAIALQDDGWYLRSDIIWAKPNPMPESVRDRPTSAHEHIFLFAKGQWRTRVVQFSSLASQRFHFGQNLRPDGKSMSNTARLPIDLATTIFDRTQFEHDFSLPPFYAEVWQKLPDGGDSDFVCGLPVEHRPAVWSARFLSANATAEEFFCEIDRIRIALPDGDDLLKRWTTADVSDSPRITSDGKRSITVHYTGEICKVDFSSHEISISHPSKAAYYYDADAIREPLAASSISRLSQDVDSQDGSDRANGGAKTNGTMKAVARVDKQRGHGRRHDGFNDRWDSMTKDEQQANGANARNVWSIATKPFSEAHFATFPPEIPRRCIKAGTSEKGQCPACGKPWVRNLDKQTAEPARSGSWKSTGESHRNDIDRKGGFYDAKSVTTGWAAGCDCNAGDPVPQTVLDPFLGSGTTLLVADELGRNGIGIELNADYAAMAERRITGACPMFAEVGVA